MPTADPNCPPHIKKAKQIFYKIIQATDGSTGGSEDYSSGINNIDMINDRDDYEDDGEEEEEDNFNNFPPKPAALHPHLDRISGGVDNSFSADRGSGPFVPSIFFLARPFFLFFCSDGNPKHPKTDRRRTKRGPFFAKMIIPPPSLQFSD